MLDQAFEALQSYDWGVEPEVLKPIDEAVVSSRENASARKELETRLAAVLKSDAPRAAKDYVCRKLRVIGTYESVPTLAEFLSDEQLSHMARYALESIPAAEAATALRDALPQLDGELQIGVISSLGVRQDAGSVASLASLLTAPNGNVARAAALALGAIRTPEASAALAKAKPVDEAQSAVTDASLSCAEALLADGKNTQALVIYKRLSSDDQPKHVRLAATRGMLACAGKS